MSKIAIVTGASSGIGRSFILALCRKGEFEAFDDIEEIWMVARRTDILSEIKSEVGDERLVPVTCDLTDHSDIGALSEMLTARKPEVKLLINCAGMGKRSDFIEKPASVHSSTVALNCTAVTLLSRLVLPYMKGGRMINISSSASFLPQPGFAVYAASKAYVTSFSRALAYELKGEGISVTNVCPGPVMTDFQKRATDGKSGEFTGFRKHIVADPDKLAAAALKASSKRRKMLVYGFSQKMLHFASKIIPTDLILWLETLNR
ncbi:MAG: SDR family NAD(P)-dependent oxidoreductase [Clostridiales bacterium]|nr:SDR family NAD(P)-dependent oxidoreductase [Clostridiales bacterium]